MRTILKPLLRGGAAAAVIALSVVGSAQQSQAATSVFQELFLSLDVSGSINDNNFELYRTGYANAFKNSTVQQNIAQTFAGGGLAIAVGQWSNTAFSPPVIDWRQITSLTGGGPNDLDTFIAELENMTRQGDDFTCIDCGMRAAIEEINTNDFVTTRTNGRVIDISTDGVGNTVLNGAPNGASPGLVILAAQAERASAEASDIIINGLGVGLNASTFLANNVVTAANDGNKAGFVETTDGFETFQAAITTKLIREVGPGPGDEVPGPLPVLGAAAAFGFSRKLRRRINTANLHKA